MFPSMKLVNQEEKIRLEDIAKRKKRGKGAPKKGMIILFQVSNF